MMHLSRHSLIAVLAFCIIGANSPLIELASNVKPKPIELGSRLELFLDHFLIGKSAGVSLTLERPHDEGIAVRFDKPWEGRFCGYATIIHDGPLYRFYYRGLPSSGRDGSNEEVTCVAES